eukprot:361525-Chlamydomonas_euryale.AAC.4
MATPGDQHLAAAKRLLRYLQGTKGLGITYGQDHSGLLGYVDSDWASDVTSRKSGKGCVATMNGGALSGGSQAQSMVA